jgi:hypothetical protein
MEKNNTSLIPDHKIKDKIQAIRRRESNIKILKFWILDDIF